MVKKKINKSMYKCQTINNNLTHKITVIKIMTIYITQCELVEVIAFCLVINDELHRLKRRLPPKIDFLYEVFKRNSLDHGSSVFPAQLANV